MAKLATRVPAQTTYCPSGNELIPASWTPEDLLVCPDAPVFIIRRQKKALASVDAEATGADGHKDN